MKNTKRLLAVMLAAVMVLGAAAVYAEDGFTDAVTLPIGIGIPNIEDLEGMMPTVDVVLPIIVQEEIAGLTDGGNWKIDRFDDTLLSYDGTLKISIGEHTQILTEEGDLFKGETFANRMLVVFYGVETMSIPAQTTPWKVYVLYEKAVTLPIDADAPGISGIVPPIYEFEKPVPPIYHFTPEEIEAFFPINGEIVIDGEIIEAPAPYYNNGVIMLPLRAVAEKLGFEVVWDNETQGVRLGVAINLWIGKDEYHIARMAPLELGTAPELTDGFTYVPINFFRSVAKYDVYVFEGQVVFGPAGDME